MTRKILVYDSSKGIDISQLTRTHPTMKRLRPHQRRKMEEYARQYIDFLNKARIAPEVVDEVSKRLERENFGSRGKDFFMTEKYDESAFAIVKFGKKPVREGLRILYSHTDSVCLQAKVRPLKFEWDPDKKELHLGVEIDTHPYGGIISGQWEGKDLRAVGWSVVNGKRKKYDFPVHSAARAHHTDPDKERVHKEDYLDVITGHKSRNDLLKAMGLKGEEDFARTRLYFVHDQKAQRIDDFYISGYNQDNKIGVFSSVQALFESKPKYTTIVVGFDKEEVGSGGLGGAKGKFFERVVNRTLREGEGRNLEHITEALREELFYKSLALNVDVDVGSTHREEDVADERNIGKLGYGVFISGVDGYWEGDQVSPSVVDIVERSFLRREVIFQTIGNAVPADEGEIPSMNEFFVDRGIPTLNVGNVLGSLHSKEISHIGDLYYAVQGNVSFIEEPKRIGRRKR